MKEKPTLIQTRRLELRSISGNDRDAMLRIFADDSIKKTYMLPDFENEEAMDRLFRRVAALSEDPSRFVYGIFFEGRLIGLLNETEKDGTSVELGYVIHPDWQNRGCMTEALAAAVRALFDMGFSAVRAAFFEGNEASRRVMEKCGMTRIDRTETIDYRGAPRRCIYYEIKAG